MTVEILCVGTELLLGNILNTDAQFLAERLSELGFDVLYQTVVGDNPERLEKALKLAKERVDIIITTGGLGPTYDDLTKELCAKVFKKKLALHEPSLDAIKGFFASIGREMTENNVKQAYMPDGCDVFENRWGTAPGCAMEHSGKYLLMFPGPPNELKPMFNTFGAPYLMKLSGSVIHSDWVRVFGMGESVMEEKLRDLMVTAKNPSVAPYAKDGECSVRITAKAKTEKQAQKMTEKVVNKVCEILGDVVYGVNVDSLEEAIVQRATADGLTVSFAESCTGGLCTKRISDISGASAVLRGGICAYSNEIKRDILGVSGEDLDKYGAVSVPVALQMARGVRRLYDTDIAVSVTGIAGPKSDNTQKPVGLVYLALAVGKGDYSTYLVRTLNLPSTYSREKIRFVTASHAFDMINKYLKNRGE